MIMTTPIKPKKQVEECRRRYADKRPHQTLDLWRAAIMYMDDKAD